MTGAQLAEKKERRPVEIRIANNAECGNAIPVRQITDAPN